MRFDIRRIKVQSITPFLADTLEEARSPWHETRAEIRAGLEKGKRKAFLLRWVRTQMDARLTERERYCVQLHFFLGLTYEQIGRVTGTSRSAVCRAVQRGLRRLRAAAQEDTSWRGGWQDRGGEGRGPS